MPDHTPVSKFIKTLRTRKTDITRSLDELFDLAYRAELETDPNLNQFKNTPHVLDTLLSWARAALQKTPHPGVVRDPVTNAELAHIDSWPPDQKEKVRLALVNAINNRRAVFFFWELYRGDVEHVAVDDTANGDPINIVFYSPYKNIDIAHVTGDIYVKVGP